MTRILRHQGFDREDDGAMDWNTLLPLFCRDSENASEWATLEWLDFFRTGSDKERFQYCVKSDGVIHHMRAIPSKVTLEETRLIHHCWVNVQVPYRWSEYFYHLGSPLKMHSSIHSGLIAGRGSIEQFARGRIPRRVKATKGTLQEPVVLYLGSI